MLMHLCRKSEKLGDGLIAQAPTVFLALHAASDQLLQCTLAADSLINASAEPTSLSALMDPTLLRTKRYTRIIFTRPDDLLQELKATDPDTKGTVVIADFAYAHNLRDTKHHGVFQIALGNPQGEWIVAPTTIDHGVTIQELADIYNVAMVDEPHAATTAILTEDQILYVMGFKSEIRRQFHQHFAKNGDLLAKRRALFVTISTQRRDDKNKLWEGVVVSCRGISSSIFNGKEKFNVICVRLKRPHIQESKGCPCI
jgi:hypothetical protein